MPHQEAYGNNCGISDIFSVFYIINVSCVYSLESPHRGESNECTQHTFAKYKEKIFLNYPYFVFG